MTESVLIPGRDLAAGTKRSSSSATPKTTVRHLLEAAADKLSRLDSRLAGTVLFQLSGKEGGQWSIECSKAGARLIQASGNIEPTCGITADATAIRSVLEGKKKSIPLLFRGGLKLQGDVSYLLKTASDLGIFANLVGTQTRGFVRCVGELPLQSSSTPIFYAFVASHIEQNLFTLSRPASVTPSDGAFKDWIANTLLSAFVSSQEVIVYHPESTAVITGVRFLFPGE